MERQSLPSGPLCLEPEFLPFLVLLAELGVFKHFDNRLVDRSRQRIVLRLLEPLFSYFAFGQNPFLAFP